MIGSFKYPHPETASYSAKKTKKHILPISIADCQPNAKTQIGIDKIFAD